MFSLKRLKACLLEWHVTPSDQCDSAEVVIAQAFGRAEFNQPGLSNKALAKVVEELTRNSVTPVILQWEVADAFQAAEGQEVFVVRQHREPGRYLDTLEVLEQALVICRQRQWTRVAVVAHPDHIWRVAVCAQKMGLTVMVPDTSGVPYDRKSVQRWTRSSIHWWPRELPVRLLCLVRGQL